MQTRVQQNVVPFAKNATVGKRYVFGETVASDLIDDNINLNILKGWEAGVDANGKPPMSWFNAVMYAATQLTAYLYQNGMPEWDANQEYYAGSFCSKNGVIYVSNYGADGSPNIGNDPETTTSWGVYTGIKPGEYSKFGIGQSWVNKTQDIVANTTYTNTTGNTIFITFADNTSSIIGAYVDGVQVINTNIDSAYRHYYTFIVPDGSTYSYNGTPTSWMEFR